VIYRCPAYRGADFSHDGHYRNRFSSSPEYPYAIGNYVAMRATDVGHIWGQPLQPDGAICPLSRTRVSDVLDGLSHTVFIVESRKESIRVWIDGRTAAITALSYDPYNHPTKSHIPTLVEAMRLGEGGVILKVGMMGPRAKWAVPTLVALLSHQRPITRAVAATALGEIGSGATQAETVLQRATKDDNERVRQAAEEALRAVRASADAP